MSWRNGPQNTQNWANSRPTHQQAPWAAPLRSNLFNNMTNSDLEYHHEVGNGGVWMPERDYEDYKVPYEPSGQPIFQPVYQQPQQYQSYQPIPPRQPIQQPIQHSRHQPSLPQSFATGNRQGVAQRTQTQLKSTQEIPASFHGLFKFSHFNAVQSLCLDTALHSGRNLVVSAPTGAGKTVVMELAMIREMTSQSWDPNCKVVYMAPTKALVSERFNDWKTKFGPMGITVCEITGDTTAAESNNVRIAQVIVTTPEKWDSVTRKWSDSHHLFSLVRLVMIDEVHVVNEPRRGAVLEAIISRMQIFGASKSSVRIVALSATVPNLTDFSTWLSDKEGSAIMKSFGEEFRPVQLQKVVIGYEKHGSDFIFDQNLNHHLLNVIQQHSHGKPTLVFCNTRKGAEKAAEYLCEKAGNYFSGGKPGPPFNNSKLQELVPRGIAFHHAGLELSDRKRVEEAFLNGHVMVLCTTSTLAVGVNLPAHCVILKTTLQYADGRYSEYSELDILQMIGRAGRPNFDDSGVAVVMTSVDKVQKYESLVRGQEVIESSLHQHLLEHINAECVLKTITSPDSARMWLKKSFMYVRMKANPTRYKLRVVETLDQTLDSLCDKDLKKLQEHGFIEWNGDKISSTELGVIMAKWYIHFDTMVNFVALEPKPTMRGILEILCKAYEFSEKGRIQSGDKQVLNVMNKSVKYPIKGKVKTLADKVFIMIQAVLGSVAFPADVKNAFNLTTDQNLIMKETGRLTRCLVEVCQYKKNYPATMLALKLQQFSRAKVWDDGLILRQLNTVGVEFARKFHQAGLKSFDDLREATDEQIGLVVGRNRGWGGELLRQVHGLPILGMNIRRLQEPKKTEMELYIHIQVLNKEHVNMEERVWFVCGCGDQLVDLREFTIKTLLNLDRSFSIKAPNSAKTVCSIYFESWVGLDLSESSEGGVGGKIQATLSGMLRHNVVQKDEFSDFVDLDQLFDEKPIQPSQVQQPKQRKKQSNPKPPVPEVFYENGFVSCDHACKDKQKCRHLCCKTGIDPKHKKKKKTVEPVSAIPPSIPSSHVPAPMPGNVQAFQPYDWLSDDFDFDQLDPVPTQEIVKPTQKPSENLPVSHIEKPKKFEFKQSRLLTKFTMSDSDDELPDPDVMLKSTIESSPLKAKKPRLFVNLESSPENSPVKFHPKPPSPKPLNGKEWLNRLHTSSVTSVDEAQRGVKRTWNQDAFNWPTQEPEPISQPLFIPPTKSNAKEDSFKMFFQSFKARPIEEVEAKPVVTATRVPFRMALNLDKL